MAESKPDPTVSRPGDSPKTPNIFERAKEEIEALVHKGKSPRHDKETHGRSNDIDEDTPVEEVKGPSVFERVKEEVEAIVGSVHHKKDDSHRPSP